MMKFWKKSAAVLLACLTVTSLTACGGGGSDDPAVSDESGNASGSESTGGAANDGDIVKLVVWGVGTADTEDCNEIAAAISEITREKIGVEIELVRGQDAEQINLALSSGEPIDLLNYNNVNGQLATIVRNSYATGLDELVEQYGQGALGSDQPCGSGCLPFRRRAVCASRYERHIPLRRVFHAEGYHRRVGESMFPKWVHMMTCTKF